MKKCTKCNIEQELSCFAKQKGTKTGHHPQCKTCRSAYDKSRYCPDIRKAEYLAQHEQEKQYRRTYYHNHKDAYYSRKAKRRALELQAVPRWADLTQIKTIYDKATTYGFEVDHIVPLKSDLVCGLHCWANLQLLDPAINRSKGNRSWPDMP